MCVHQNSVKSYVHRFCCRRLRTRHCFWMVHAGAEGDLGPLDGTSCGTRARHASMSQEIATGGAGMSQGQHGPALHVDPPRMALPCMWPHAAARVELPQDTAPRLGRLTMCMPLWATMSMPLWSCGHGSLTSLTLGAAEVLAPTSTLTLFLPISLMPPSVCHLQQTPGPQRPLRQPDGDTASVPARGRPRARAWARARPSTSGHETDGGLGR